MKKIIFISEMALLEPNLSIIKRLKNEFDLYYISDCRHDIPNKFGITRLRKRIDTANNYQEMNKFSPFLDLEKTYLIHSLSNKKIFNAIRKAFDSFLLIKKISPDIIITDTTAPFTILTFLFYIKKIILLIHDPFSHSGYKKKWIEIFRNIVFKKNKVKVIFNNKQYNEFIKKYNLISKDVFCANLSTFEFMDIYKPLQNTRNSKNMKILFWGIISQYKGIEYLCEGFKRLNNPNIELTIAGSGKLYFDISPYLQLNNLTFIHKYLSNEEIAQLLIDTDIVICPYTDATQSGIIMCAFAYNKPVIATKVGGIPEVVDEKSGILIEPKNIEQISNAILYLYKNPNIIKEMHTYLKNEYNKTKHGWDYCVNQIKLAIKRQNEESNS